jgi:hypothetical protein
MKLLEAPGHKGAPDEPQRPSEETEGAERVWKTLNDCHTSSRRSSTELSALPRQEGKNRLRRANLGNSRSHKTHNNQMYAQTGIDMMQSVEADPPPVRTAA